MIRNSLISLCNSYCKQIPLVVRRSVAYKSSISLENLYPGSSLKLRTPEKVAQVSDEFDGFIPIDKLEIIYSKSSGPGGQNVNKVNTKVDLRFHLESAEWLSDNIKSSIRQKYNSRITKEGHLIFRSDLTRSQQLNLADCLEKLRSCIRDSVVLEHTPTPETEERIRKRMEKAARERLRIKRERSRRNEERRVPEFAF
ncbi:large ribosomal subunit protein mL62 [Cylas formicarius]|uniref:large ribosomal subunit protein mL62 n=1 Tax=Cylas formicarius TaxID=197179 RepID=UPI002958A55E|nr:large ribosomal subunit protein mL62 [Cylas formicarius]